MFWSLENTGKALAEENDRCWAAHWSVLPREGKRTRCPIDAKSGDGVGELVAHVQEIPDRVEVESARMVTAGPFFAAIRQRPSRANGETDNAVVQAVGSV